MYEITYCFINSVKLMRICVANSNESYSDNVELAENY